jgi:hypothetical protein
MIKHNKKVNSDNKKIEGERPSDLETAVGKYSFTDLVTTTFTSSKWGNYHYYDLEMDSRKLGYLGQKPNEI